MSRNNLMRYVRRVYHLLHVGDVLSFLVGIRTRISIPLVKRRYANVLHRLQYGGGKKARVVFLVSDSSKWKVQSLYDKLSRNQMFDMLVAVTLYGWHDNVAKAETKAHETYSYFKVKGMPVIYAYSFNSHKPIPLNNFAPDLVFYDQPWDVFPCHSPSVVAEYALTFYVDYGVPNLEISITHCALPFHQALFCHYTMSDSWTRLAQNICKKYSMAGNMVPTGHPMLDVFSRCKVSICDFNGCVIYAPHWSFPHKDNPNSYDLSTFLWSGRLMLDYARRHREIRWAFKPHPVLGEMLIKSGVMSEDEVNAYYRAWSEIGECCYTGDYPDLFKHSFAMITDSSSFLLEYACTHRPLIRLVNVGQKARFCSLCRPLLDTYYQVRSPEELEPMLDKIIVRREDPNKEARLAAAKAMNLTGVDAAGNIVKHLEGLVLGER